MYRNLDRLWVALLKDHSPAPFQPEKTEPEVKIPPPDEPNRAYLISIDKADDIILIIPDGENAPQGLQHDLNAELFCKVKPADMTAVHDAGPDKMKPVPGELGVVPRVRIYCVLSS